MTARNLMLPKLAPPQPAPDAMRSLENLRLIAEDVVWFDWSNNDQDAVHAIDQLRLALAALSPGTGAGGEMRTALENARLELVLAISFLGRDAGSDRLQKTITTLIDRFHKADDAIRAVLASPSGTGAAEPVALANALEKSDWSNTTIGNKALIQNAIRTLRANPPVRGDRELPPVERIECVKFDDTLVEVPAEPADREAIMKTVMSLSNISGMQAGALADAILSLPVQSGAGEREVVMPRELSDEQADAALRATAVWLEVKGSQLTVNREKMKARYASLVKFVVSRQAPQSSREG